MTVPVKWTRAIIAYGRGPGRKCHSRLIRENFRARSSVSAAIISCRRRRCTLNSCSGQWSFILIIIWLRRVRFVKVALAHQTLAGAGQDIFSPIGVT
jgi:hypothetical protein